MCGVCVMLGLCDDVQGDAIRYNLKSGVRCPAKVTNWVAKGDMQLYRGSRCVRPSGRAECKHKCGVVVAFKWSAMELTRT